MGFRTVVWFWKRLPELFMGTGVHNVLGFRALSAVNFLSSPNKSLKQQLNHSCFLVLTPAFNTKCLQFYTPAAYIACQIYLWQDKAKVRGLNRQPKWLIVHLVEGIGEWGGLSVIISKSLELGKGTRWESSRRMPRGKRQTHVNSKGCLWKQGSLAWVSPGFETRTTSSSWACEL